MQGPAVSAFVKLPQFFDPPAFLGPYYMQLSLDCQAEGELVRLRLPDPLFDAIAISGPLEYNEYELNKEV